MSTAIVGQLIERDAELSAIGDAVAAARAGVGAVVVVEGEAGIGKTSLCQPQARWRRA